MLANNSKATNEAVIYKNPKITNIYPVAYIVLKIDLAIILIIYKYFKFANKIINLYIFKDIIELLIKYNPLSPLVNK